MADARRTITVDAPGDRTWSVLADFGAIVDWAPDVDHSSMLTQQADGVGAARRVQVGRLALVETITAWDPPHRLSYAISGLPARLGAVSSEWRIDARGDGCDVTLVNSVDPGPRPPQQLVGRLVARRLAATSAKMLTGLAAHVTQGARS